MARLTSNLVNASQIKWKKWKKVFEIGEIRTHVKPFWLSNEAILLKGRQENCILFKNREFPRILTIM